MKPRSRATLGRALEDLGSTLLEVVHGEPALAEEIGAVVIHDRLDSSALPLRSLVLGVGVGGSEEISRLLIELGKQHALGLILRAPVAADESVIAATTQSGVPVIGLSHGASWAQVAALLRSELADGDMWSATTETLGGTPSGDLFTLANAVAALLDAPITIEDRNSRILAFAGRQEEADPSRVEAILGRQVPERFILRYVERGVFRQLYGTDQPMFVEALDADVGADALPRMAVAVRAGDEVLGSIWVVVSEPKSAEWSRSLADAAKLVALHMMRSRAGDEIERRRRTELVSTALDGGADAREALNRLGLADRPIVVLALAVADAADAAQSVSNDADLAAEHERMRDAFAMHLSAVHPRSAVATIGGVVYGLLAVAHETAASEQHAVRVARDFVDRVGGRARVVIAVSSVISDAPELGRARSNAMRALHVLRTAGAGTRRVARLEDVHVESQLLDLRYIAELHGDRPTGTVARLLEYDEQHHTNLVDTLRAWLDAFGDVNVAAKEFPIHPNTFRYRVKRVAEIGEIDLTDPGARFAAMLQLRVGVGIPEPKRIVSRFRREQGL